MEVALEFGSTPYPTNNPYYDAMDSSDGTVNTFYTASDSGIDVISNGDGYINVVMSMSRFAVPWIRASSITPGIGPARTGCRRFTPIRCIGRQIASPRPASGPSGTKRTQYHCGSGSSSNGRNLTAQVPIRVLAADPLPLRVLMLNVHIEPLDGSPAIKSSATFSPVTNVGAPTQTASSAPNDYGAAWLDSTVTGVTGTNLIGTLTVACPPMSQPNRRIGSISTTSPPRPTGWRCFTPRSMTA